MKRSLNPRVATAILASVFVIAAVMFVAHRLQAGRSASVFLQAAEKSASANEYSQAVRNYRSYLRLKPDDASAHARLGSLLVEIQDFSSAYGTLEQALLLDPKSSESRRQVVRAAMGIGRFADAKVHLEQLIDEQPDAELLDHLGQCQQAAAEPLQAVQSYREAISRDPHRVEAYFRLANLLNDPMGRPGEAEAALQSLVENNPENATAYLLRAQFLKRASDNARASGQNAVATEKLELARQEAEQGWQREPENAEAILLLAQCELAQDAVDEARRRAESGRELEPTLARWHLLLAEIETQAGKSDQAIHWLRQGLRDAEQGREELLGNLANMLLDRGDVDEAKRAVEQIRSLGSNPSLAAYLQGRIAFAQSQWLAASNTLESVRPAFLDNNALLKQIDYWLGECYYQLGKSDLQLTAYRRALASDPFWVRARLGVVSALVAMGQTESALQELKELMRLPGAPAEGALEMARLMILQNYRAGANQANWAAVSALLDHVAKTQPDLVAVPILQAEILVGQGRLEQATALLQDAADASPKQTDLWLALVNLAQRQRLWQRADEVLQQAEDQVGDQVAIRLAKASLLSRQAGDEVNQQLRELGTPSDSFSETDKLELWNGLVPQAMANGDYSFAEELLAKISKANPHNLQVWLLRFEVILRQEKIDDLSEILAQIRSIEGEGPLWHYGTAIHLRLRASGADSVELQQALGHLSKASVERPAWARLPLLTAEIQLMQGDAETALSNLLQAITLGERDSAVVRQTLQLLYQRQRYREADELIRLVEKRQQPFSTDMGRLASQISVQLQDFERALDVARRASAASQDHRDQVWLGQVATLVAGRLGDDKASQEQKRQLNEEAEQAFRRAVTLAEQEPETWVALVRFLSRDGQLESLEPILEEAATKIPAEKAPLALAQCYELLGKADEAKSRYDAALELDPRDPSSLQMASDFYLRQGDPQKAEEFLRRLKTHEAASIGDVVWARRQLALIELSKGGLGHLSIAQRLIDENLEVDSSSLPDLRARALVLSAYKTPHERSTAIETWKRVIELDPAISPEQRLNLAQLYIAEGNWPEASRQMRSLIAGSQAHPNHHAYIAQYVTGLLANGELSEAELWIQRIQGMKVDPSTIASLQAGVLSQRGEHKQAIDTLLGIVNPENRYAVALRMESLANALETESERTLYDEQAQQLLQAASLEEPDQSLALAGFLARRNQSDAALSELERAASLPAAPVASLAVIGTILASDAATPAHLKRAEVLLQRFIALGAQSNDILLRLADVYLVQQMLDKALTVYEKILQKDPAHVIALNNSAMILVNDSRRLDEAKQRIEEAMKIGGRTPTLLDSRAVVALAQGEPQNALPWLKDALDQEPAAGIYFHLAVLHHQLGAKQEAALSLQQAEQANLKIASLSPLEKRWYAALAK